MFMVYSAYIVIFLEVSEYGFIIYIVFLFIVEWIPYLGKERISFSDLVVIPRER